MQIPKPTRDPPKPPKPLEIIVLGSPSQYPQLCFLQEQLDATIPNFNLKIIENPSNPSAISSIFLNVTNQTILFILTKTCKDLILTATKTLPNKNNIIFYLECSDKQSKLTKVASRWQFYKLILKKVQPKILEPTGRVEDTKLIPICVRILRSQNNEFNSLLSALAIKYTSSKQIVDFKLISNIKQLLEGRYQKRILIVHNREGEYAKHYLTEVMGRNQKVYSILFEGSKISEYNFNTSSVGDVEHLLDSLLINYNRKKDTSQRIKMKSVKKVSDTNPQKSRVVVVQSMSHNFNQLFMGIEGAQVLTQLRSQNVLDRVNIIVHYNECAQALAHVVAHQGLSVLVFAETLLPNQIFRHPSVRLITDNPEDIIKYIQGKNSITSYDYSKENIGPRLSIRQRKESHRISHNTMQNELTFPHPPISSQTILSSRLLTKSRGVFPNGMQFMEWDTRLIKNSHGVFCTYPQDEPERFQHYLNGVPPPPSLDYIPFETFGKLKTLGLLKNNPNPTSSDFEHSEQEKHPSGNSRVSIIQELIPVISISDVRQLNPIQEKRERSSYSNSDEKSNQSPNLPMQSQLFTQTKESKIEFSESFDNMYQDGATQQMNSKFIQVKERQSSMQSQSKIAFEPPKHRFKSENINMNMVMGLKPQRQSTELSSFLTSNGSSDQRMKDSSQKELMIIQEEPFGTGNEGLKESKSFQTDQSYFKQTPRIPAQYTVGTKELEILIQPETKWKANNQPQPFSPKEQYVNYTPIKEQPADPAQKLPVRFPRMPKQQYIQIVAKRNYNFIDTQLYTNTVFDLYQFYTNSELKYIALRMNPDIRTILIVSEVPEPINYFREYLQFDCIVIPGTKLYHHQKIIYPRFKWILEQDYHLIPQIVSEHIRNTTVSEYVQVEPLTVLYFYDEGELQKELTTHFGQDIRYQMYHSPQSLLAHVDKSPLAVILNLPFEWISEEIREKNPGAHLIMYSKEAGKGKGKGAGKSPGGVSTNQDVLEWIENILDG